MSVVLRAADVPVASRAEYVHEVVGAALGPLDVRTGDGNEVPDQVRVADLCKSTWSPRARSSSSRTAAKPASVPATSRSSTSPAPPTGPTRGRHRSWPSPSRASSSRFAATTSPG